MKVIKNILLTIISILFLMLVAVAMYLHFPSRQAIIPFDYGDWNNGTVRHILPQFDHNQIALKVSLEDNVNDAPELWIDDLKVVGKACDQRGRFWSFNAEGLNPNTNYTLQLKSTDGLDITDSWSITTFPHPDSSVQSLSMLKYTCAGGISESIFGQEIFLEMGYRRALLERAIKENPRVVVANGDHVYWDQKTSEKSLIQRLIKYRRERMYGSLDLSKSVLSDPNYGIFTSIIDDQIVALYGCLLRDKSIYFVTDDHDLFENDDAIKAKNIISFPPKPYMLDAAAATAQLYYPEVLNSGLKKAEETGYGSFRYGDLVHLSYFDAKRGMDLEEDEAVLVHPEIEHSVVESTLDTSFVWHMVAPSSPFAWTAGKWAEWYPDILTETGMRSDVEKYLWQPGWWKQHQRLLKAFHQRETPSIILQGDLHMASYGQIYQSGDLNFEDKPIHVITTAPLGSGDRAFPSSFRGVSAQVPIDMKVKELYPPVERNGFTILEISKQHIDFDIYTWRLPETLNQIYNLNPGFSATLGR